MNRPSLDAGTRLGTYEIRDLIKEADEAQAGSSDINIVVNWTEELKRRLPAD